MRRLLAGSLPGSPLAAPRLHGEVDFTGHGGRQKSPDAAIDCWPNLVLVEVFSGRFAREARASADPDLILRSLERATVEKIAEVLARAGDVLAGRLVYPGSVGPARRIWPLIVLAGDAIALTPLHWHWFRERLAQRDDLPVQRLDGDPRVQRPAIADLDDLEPLLTLVERGRAIVELLGRFLSSTLAEGDLRGWLAATFVLDSRDQPAYVCQQWELAMQAGGGSLYPGSERIEQAIADADRAVP